MTASPFERLREVSSRCMRRLADPGCGLPHPSIVRLVEMTPIERVDAMRNLIERHADAMRERAIIVVTDKSVRIRPATSVEHDDE